MGNQVIVDRVLDTFAGGVRPPDARTIDRVPVMAVWFTIDAAAKAGFAGDDLIVAGALAGRESYWSPWVTNFNEVTKDRSWGLWQLNTRQSSAWDAVKADLGLGLELQLLDPVVNAKAAKWLYDRSPDVPFRAWGPYKNVPPLWGSAARNVAVVVDLAVFFGYVKGQ